jgi:hypothetical protein
MPDSVRWLSPSNGAVERVAGLYFLHTPSVNNSKHNLHGQATGTFGA